MLLFNAIPGLTIIHVATLTLLLVLLWCAISLLVYREYGATLLQTIKRRALGEVALTLTDEASLTAVHQLLQSNQIHEVRLALDILETADHPTLPDQLLSLASHAQPDIQIEALHRLEQHKSMAALPVVLKVIERGGNTAVQGAALQTLCALNETEAVHTVTPYLKHNAPARRQGALVGLLRYGGISGIMAAAPYLDQAQQSTTITDRVMAAQVIGAVQRQEFYEPLLALLQDEAQEVRQAALTAAAQVRHLRLLPLIINNLQQTATRSTALATLQAYGHTILPLTAAALDGATAYSHDDIKRLVRVCGQIGGERTVALLRQHLQHPHHEIQEQILLPLIFVASKQKRPIGTLSKPFCNNAPTTPPLYWLCAKSWAPMTPCSPCTMPCKMNRSASGGSYLLYYLCSMTIAPSSVLKSNSPKDRIVQKLWQWRCWM